MKLRYSLVLFSLCFLSLLSFSQTNEKWSLEKCIDYALKNNLQVKRAQLTSQVSEKDNLQSWLNLLPSINAGATYSNNFGNGFNPQTYSFAQGNSQSFQPSLSASIPLFTGLQQVHNIERAKYDLLAAHFDYENAKNNISLSVASAYLQILLNKEIEKIAEKQHALTADQKEMVKSRVKAGALPESSMYDIESQLGRDDVGVINAKSAVDLSVLALRQLLQLHSESGFDIDMPAVNADNMADIGSLSSQSIFDFALKSQPSIKSAEARLKSANAMRKASIGTLSPTISAFGSLSSGYFSQDRTLVRTIYDTVAGIPIPVSAEYEKTPVKNQFQNNFRKAVGLSLDFPIFSRGQRILNIQKAKLQQQITQLNLEGSKNQLQQDIEQAFANARVAAESYLANKKSVEASQRAYDAAENRYRAGASNNFDLQQAKNNLVAAESEIVKAKYTYIFRLKILDFYQDKPITLN
ncbi:MAG: TolC family protein [Bacteroidetes bacterium]|nr:TolC family protein [Bacteroidota bacterium]